MGQKVNPVGLRLGIVRGWESSWYGGKTFSDKLVEDEKIRKYVYARIPKGGISKVVIERTLKRIILTVHTARPGVVIGKGGSEVDKVKEELKKLMLESRVRVINARMVDIDRSDKNIILHDNTVVPYDTLILGMGIQDKTLNTLGYGSRGIAPLPKGLERADGILSIDDPYLYDHLRKDGTLINMLTDKKRVKNCVLYGRSLNTYCCI